MNEPVVYNGKIRPRHRAFADEWLTGAISKKPFNAKAAYEAVGYKPTTNFPNPYYHPHKLLRHPDVKAYLAWIMEQHSMTTQEVLYRLSEVARYSGAGAVLKKNEVTGKIEIDPDAVLENAQFVRGYGLDANGNPKIEFHDSMAALTQLVKILKMSGSETLQLLGPGGGPVQLQVQFVMPDGSTTTSVDPDVKQLPAPVESTFVETFDEFDE